AASNTAELCSLITRDAGTGRVVNVLDVFLNVASARTRGVDMEVIYRAEPNFFADASETFSLRGLLGHTMERSDTAPGATPLERSGSLGLPDLTSNLTATYGVGRYSFQLQA